MRNSFGIHNIANLIKYYRKTNICNGLILPALNQILSIHYKQYEQISKTFFFEIPLMDSEFHMELVNKLINEILASFNQITMLESK